MAANATKKKRGSGNAGSPANSFAEMKDLITQMESFIKEAEALATMEIRRVEEIKESLKASLTRLTALFREKEAALLTHERTTQELEESLAARARELERQLEQKESALLAHQETLRAMEARAARAASAPKAPAGQVTEGPSSIREAEEASLHRPPPARHSGVSPPGGEGAARDAGSTGSRLVSLLGPIKRRG